MKERETWVSGEKRKRREKGGIFSYYLNSCGKGIWQNPTPLHKTVRLTGNEWRLRHLTLSFRVRRHHSLSFIFNEMKGQGVDTGLCHMQQRCLFIFWPWSPCWVEVGRVDLVSTSEGMPYPLSAGNEVSCRCLIRLRKSHSFPVRWTFLWSSVGFRQMPFPWLLR